MTTAADRLRKLAEEKCLSLTDPQFAEYLDSVDPLANFRNEFEIPRKKNLPQFVGEDGEETCLYLLGSGLGLQPKRSRRCVAEQFDKWANMGLAGQYQEPLPWYSIGEDAAAKMVPIVGASSSQEVAVLTSLTNNLHLLLVSFYRPTAARHKIVMEAEAFPSDRYAAVSHIKFHGFDPKQSLVQLQPRPGEDTLRTEDVVAFLEAEGSSVSILLLSGVQFITGQLFNISSLTKAAHKQGCYAGFDLAHAVGNVPLALHDWNVDFAFWCSYKFLNGGPGAIGGLFVHERHATDASLNRFAGWWGNDPSTRFEMAEEFVPFPGAASFQLSIPPVLVTACLIASLEIFETTSVEELREKSLLLTGYLEILLHECLYSVGASADDGGESKAKRASAPLVEIITPADESQRGAQLSVRFSADVGRMHAELQKRGVVVDVRKSNVIRMSPVPLYNTFREVHSLVNVLRDVLKQVTAGDS